jgi:hypothetical protein
MSQNNITSFTGTKTPDEQPTSIIVAVLNGSGNFDTVLLDPQSSYEIFHTALDTGGSAASAKIKLAYANVEPVVGTFAAESNRDWLLPTAGFNRVPIKKGTQYLSLQASAANNLVVIRRIDTLGPQTV